MISPSERAIAVFLSKTFSTRNRAILYLGITDGNVDDAVALFKSKPDESFRAALSRSAIQFRRPLAKGAEGYEDKYGVIHLETSTEDGNDEEAEAGCTLTGGNKQSRIRENEHPPPRAAITEHKELSRTTNRSCLGGRIAIESTKKREKKNLQESDQDSTYEPEENSAPLHQASPPGRNKKLLQCRHRGRFARGPKVLGFRAHGATDDEKPISSRTRKRTIFKQVSTVSKKSQGSCLRNDLPINSSSRKRVIGVTPPPTPHAINLDTAQSRFKQTKRSTSGVANPRTFPSSNPFGIDSYPTPTSISSNRKTSSIRLHTDNPQDPSEEILPSEFHRSSFESMSPLAMKSDFFNKSKTQDYQRDESEIPLLTLYHSKKSNRDHHYQSHPPKIHLQDLYLAPPSPISRFSFHSAMNLAREKKKWLLINIQSATEPACGVLDREIWRHPEIAHIVSQSFLFLQLDQNDERAKTYLGIYYDVFDLDEGGEGIVCAGNIRKFIKLPHIAILDPITRHRWKVWDGPGLPDKNLFLADLCEYEMVGEGGWCEWGKGVIRERD